MVERPGRLVAWCGAGLAALGGMLLLLPLAIDAGAFKPALEARLSTLAGRTVAIRGPLSFALLPQPRLVADAVEVGSVPGTPSIHLMKARQVAVTVPWHRLVLGRLTPSRVDLDSPEIRLEGGAGGLPNWQFAGFGDDDDLETRLQVRDGDIGHAGALLVARGVDMSGALSGAGLLQAEGTATVNGVPARARLALRLAPSVEPPVNLSLDVPGGRLAFDGWPGDLSDRAPMRGRLSVDASFLPAFGESLLRLAHRRPLRLDAAVAREVRLAADFAWNGHALSLDAFDVAVDGERANGALRLEDGPVLGLSGRISAAALDADRWLERLRGSTALSTSAEDGAAGWWDGVRMTLAASVDRLMYRHGTVRDVATAISIEAGTLAVRELQATLPGDFRVYRRAGTVGIADGAISVEGDDLRTTLAWLGIDAAGFPAGRLQRFRLDGRTVPTPGRLRLAEASFALDDQFGTATADIDVTGPLRISSRIEMPQFDLDAYRLTRAALDALERGVPMPAPSAALPATFELDLAIGRVLYRGAPAADVGATVTVRGNDLTVHRVAVADLVGARLGFSGAVESFGTAPRYDFRFEAAARDADRLLTWASLPRFMNGRLGAARVAGAATGTLHDAELRDLSVLMLDARFTASGWLKFGDEVEYDFPSFALSSPDSGALVAAATGGTPSSLGPLQASGQFRGSRTRAAFQGDIGIGGTQLAGSLSSTLAERPRIEATFQAGDVLSLGGAGGGGADGAVAALRRLDGRLTLRAPGLAYGPLQVADAGIALDLEDGVLRIGSLGGTVAGAPLSLTGSLDARSDSAVLGASGDLVGVEVAPALAMIGRPDSFGNADLSVTLSGRLSLFGITLSSQGGTVAELLAGLSGSARLAGALRATATGGSPGVDALASGIAGLFDTDMGFTSAVLSSFIGTTVETRGTVLLSGDVLTLQGQALVGAGATATLRGPIDLGQGTLDLQVALEGYRMVLQGPLSGPALVSAP